MHPEGPAISTQVFLVFVCLQANAEMVPKFHVATACFSYSPPYFKLIKITPLLWTPPIFFLIIDKTIRNSKFRSLSEATPYHHNVFTFTLFLPEGRASVAWEPSNKIMLSLSLSRLQLRTIEVSLNQTNYSWWCEAVFSVRASVVVAWRLCYVGCFDGSPFSVNFICCYFTSYNFN
jgi:hypothetical protein